MTKEEIEQDYEVNTGKVIIECIKDKNPMKIPAILAWGTSPANAVYNAVVMETVAEMAYKTKMLNPSANRAPQFLLDKHYYRKHGENAYYGQD